MPSNSGYLNAELMRQVVERGDHRSIIGGNWELIGALQLDMLKSRGMRPHHTLVDIGCGGLRLGVRAVAYLDPGNYWGTDVSPDLMRAGYEREIVPAGLGDRLPRTNLVEDAEFELTGAPKQIDYAMAQSVFTHLPLNDMRLCLARLARHVTGPCEFLFTIFLPGDDPMAPREHVPGIVTYPHKDPFHYSLDDVTFAAAGSGFRLEFIGEWGHPRGQQLVSARIG